MLLCIINKSPLPGMSPFKNNYRQRSGLLNVDVYETERELVAACDIPGLEKKEDVHIDIDNNVWRYCYL
ncbi:hypothetical protein J15TS10_21610 [Paenibacillus woosongensis]|uniref:SHSP domain-containing protein n=1 Tax=Paenibacillus woosongensis TaxID=307580 RepID=A0ABQ4MRL3_9BACL|nr:hypothetical protein J15TS10_21610 [Paenibacillus woosongensis]